MLRQYEERKKNRIRTKSLGDGGAESWSGGVGGREQTGQEKEIEGRRSVLRSFAGEQPFQEDASQSWAHKRSRRLVGDIFSNFRNKKERRKLVKMHVSTVFHVAHDVISTFLHLLRRRESSIRTSSAAFVEPTRKASPNWRVIDSEQFPPAEQRRRQRRHCLH